jgi:His Kinase A (phospho-acceptor) domain
MPKIDLPIAETKGAASSHPNTDHQTCGPIDWRQLSHELRTPLNAILGNVELLLDGSTGPLSAQARTCLAEVQVAGHWLLRQVRMLLAWSELSASAPKLIRRRVDLIALIREASRIDCSDAAPVEPHDACLPICGDPFWLQMLIAEIMALDGAPRAALTVRLERHAGSRALGFAWSGFCAARTGPLHMALIEGIARLQGAVVARNSDGLTLHWPLEQLDGAETARGAQEPDPAGCLAAEPSSETERP